MNPLYVDSQRVGLGVDKRSLYVKDLKSNKLIEKFEPRSIPYDSVIIQRPNGYLSFAALNWLVKHAISLTVLNWRGNILAQFVPEEPINPELKIAQVKAYLDRERHVQIARTIVETKLKRQKEFLKSLSESYPISIPQVPFIRSLKSEDFIRNQEARYATAYFAQFGSVCEEIGYSFKGRNQTKNNMHAPDLPNGLLNYSYAILQTYLRRALNSIGLDNSIPFLHDLRKNAGLVYDLMELWRTNADYSVLQTLEQLKRTKKTHKLTDEYEILLNPSTIKTLIEKIRFNLSMEELLFNSRLFARFLLEEKKTLDFVLRPIHVPKMFETDRIKSLILSKSARQLGVPKATLFYQKKMLRETGTLRLYRTTRRYYA